MRLAKAPAPRFPKKPEPDTGSLSRTQASCSLHFKRASGRRWTLVCSLTRILRSLHLRRVGLQSSAFVPSFTGVRCCDGTILLTSEHFAKVQKKRGVLISSCAFLQMISYVSWLGSSRDSCTIQALYLLSPSLCTRPKDQPGKACASLPYMHIYDQSTLIPKDSVPGSQSAESHHSSDI